MSPVLHLDLQKFEAVYLSGAGTSNGPFSKGQQVRSQGLCNLSSHKSMMEYGNFMHFSFLMIYIVSACRDHVGACTWYKPCSSFFLAVSTGKITLQEGSLDEPANGDDAQGSVGSRFVWVLHSNHPVLLIVLPYSHTGYARGLYSQRLGYLLLQTWKSQIWKDTKGRKGNEWAKAAWVGRAREITSSGREWCGDAQTQCKK